MSSPVSEGQRGKLLTEILKTGLNTAVKASAVQHQGDTADHRRIAHVGEDRRLARDGRNLGKLKMKEEAKWLTFK